MAEPRAAIANGGAMPDGAAPADPICDDWDTPLLHLDGFEGPMDLLLDLAERQRIDLGRLSFVELAGQFVAECEGRLREIPLQRRADWLVTAARLLLLRSRLLLARGAEEAAARAARAELGRVEEAASMRAAASWLSARPQLGVDVFARPLRAPDPRVASYFVLMEACLAVLRGRTWRDEPAQVYTPPFRDLWRVEEALSRFRAMLVARPEGGLLTIFLPSINAGPQFETKARAAVASSFVAALELCRTEEAVVDQAGPHIRVAAKPLECGSTARIPRHAHAGSPDPITAFLGSPHDLCKIVR